MSGVEQQQQTDLKSNRKTRRAVKQQPKAKTGAELAAKVKAVVEEAVALGPSPAAMVIWEIAEPAVRAMFESMGPRAVVLGLFNALVSDPKNRRNIQNGTNMFLMGMGQLDEHVPELFRVCVEHIQVSSNNGKSLLNSEDPAWSRVGRFLSTVLNRNIKHESFISAVVFMVWATVSKKIEMPMAVRFFERMVTYKQHNQMVTERPSEDELICAVQVFPELLEYARLIPRIEDILRAIPKIDIKDGEGVKSSRIAEMCTVSMNSGMNPTLADMVELPRAVSACIVGHNEMDISSGLSARDMFKSWRKPEDNIRATSIYLSYRLPPVLRMFVIGYDGEERPLWNDALIQNQHRVLFTILLYLLGEEYGFITEKNERKETDKPVLTAQFLELCQWLYPTQVADSSQTSAAAVSAVVTAALASAAAVTAAAAASPQVPSDSHTPTSTRNGAGT